MFYASVIAIEKQRAVLHSHLVTFDTTELRTVEVQHKVILPTAESKYSNRAKDETNASLGEEGIAESFLH